jgi:regulator of protease activity HflC (stomatin/prohibitin superfamily)
MPPEFTSAFVLGIAAERRRQQEARQATLARLAEIEAQAAAEISQLRAEAKADKARFYGELHRCMQISDAAVAERPARLN